MAAKWEKKEDGVYRDGELIATLNAEGVPTVLKGMENQKSMVTRFLNGFKPEETDGEESKENKEDKEKGSEQPGKQSESFADGEIPPDPPPMDPLLGSKTPAFAAWKKRYNPTYEQICRMVPAVKHSERKADKK